MMTSQGPRTDVNDEIHLNWLKKKRKFMIKRTGQRKRDIIILVGKSS